MKVGTKDGFSFEFEKDRQNDRLNIVTKLKFGLESNLSTMADSK
jgi:hypothetical protein